MTILARAPRPALASICLAAVLPMASSAQGTPFGPLRDEGGLAAAGIGDADPALTFDKLRIVFASARPGGAGGLDLLTATRVNPSQPWGAPAPVAGPGIATPAGEWAPALDPLGTVMVFASDRIGGTGGADLWSTSRGCDATTFAAPAPLSSVNTPGNDTDPELSADGSELLFASDFLGGPAGRRLWRATRADPSLPFGSAQPIAALDAPGQEHSPALSRDGLTLFFASTPPGGGPSSVWSATRLDRSSPFGNAVLVAELSAAGGDPDVELCFDDWSVYVTQPVAGVQRILRADRVLPIVEDLTGEIAIDQPWSVWVRSKPGDTAWLLLAFGAIAPVAIPGFEGAFELDPTSTLMFHTGACDAFERTVAHLVAPNDMGLVGLEVHLQAVIDTPVDLSLKKFSKRLKRAVKQVFSKLERCKDDLVQCSNPCVQSLPATARRCAVTELYQLYFGPSAYATAVAQCVQSQLQGCLTDCLCGFARCVLR